MLRVIVIFSLALANTAVFGQAPYLYFDRISTAHGLSHNKVNCILQDRRGFIWLGTSDGLNRYDGQYFTVFRNQPSDTTTISGNIIMDLLEDENGILWIATMDGGLTKYDYRLPGRKQFKQFKHVNNSPSTIPVNIVNKLVEDKRGYIWLATSGSYVLRFNKKTETFEIPAKTGTRTVASVVIDEKGILWAGRIGGSFLKVNTQTLQYEVNNEYNNLYAKLPHATITSLYRDHENNIWFGSWDKVLYRWKAATKKEEVFKKEVSAFSFPDDEVQSFAEDNQGRMWMGGRYYGLTIYDKKQHKFFNYRADVSQEGSLSDNSVNCVYIDRGGLVWLGTNQGLSIYNPKRQAFVQTFLPHGNKALDIYDFFENEDNKLWVATSKGIFVQSGDGSFKLRKIRYKGEQLGITKFFKDEDGTFYLGTPYSLFIYEPKTNRVSLLPNTGRDIVMKKIIDSRVVSIIRDTIERHPVLLVSPYGHYITYYDLVEKKWISRMDSAKQILTNFNLKDNLIRKFYRTQNGKIFLATAKYGLADWKRQLLPRVSYLSNNPKIKETISNDNVFDILEDRKGNLWVSTYGGGLNYYNTTTSKFTHISSSNNLLEGIETDSQGNVWLISNGNLDKYDPGKKAYTSYELPNVQKSGGVKGYIYKDKTGNLYIAGTNYFIKFNPALIKDTTRPLKVCFTDFKIFNESFSELLENKNIQLRYFQNYFSIQFSAPDFTGDAIQYSYMLEAVDKSWVEAGSLNFANYSNLPGGEYVFKVRASNKKGNWADNITSIVITIKPPFWQKWWFYLLCLCVVAGAIYLLHRYRISELLKRQAIRNRIAQDLHDSMGSTLSSISVYSQVAKIYYQQEKQEQLWQTLEKIGETSGEMIAEMGDTVWAINPRNDHMSTIIQRMESYAKPLLQAKNIQFNFNYDPLVPALNLHMDKRKNFYLIFKEAINNALKYSNCKTLTADIHIHHQEVSLKVKDDGVGFDLSNMYAAASKSLSGNGLKNMQTRAKEMKAAFTVESEPGKGTMVALSFNIP